MEKTKKPSNNGTKQKRRTKRDLTKSKYAFLLGKPRILRNFLVDDELEILVREKGDQLEAAGIPNDLPERLRRVCEEFVGEAADDTIKALIENRLSQVARDLSRDVHKIVNG